MKNNIFDNFSHLRTENWLLHLIEDAPLNYFEVIEQLYEEKFSIRHVGINRQEIQFWKANQLVNISEAITEKREWSKISFFNLCWLRTIKEMRRLGMDISTIQKVKEFLFNVDQNALDMILEAITNAPEFEKLRAVAGEKAIKEFCRQLPGVKDWAFGQFNYFVMLILVLLDKDIPIYLIVFPEPNQSTFILPISNEMIETKDLLNQFLQNRSFYAIFLNTVTSAFFDNPKIKETEIQQLFRLSKSEIKILQLLRQENIKEIKIRYSIQAQKRCLMVEVTENKDIGKMRNKLYGLLEKEKFKKIVIQTEGKNLVFVEETTKIKIPIE